MSAPTFYNHLLQNNFFKKHWASSEVIKIKWDDVFKDHLMNFEELRSEMANSYLDPDSVHLFKNNQPYPAEFLYETSMVRFPIKGKTEKNLNFNKIFEKVYAEKYSLKLFNLDQYSTRLYRFVREMSMTFKHQISLNAYYTPAGQAVCFLPHTDNYNIFIFQIKGSKKWFYNSRDLEPSKTKFLPEELKESLLLKAGDILYLPENTPHYAQTLDEDSFHITLGLHPITQWHYLSYLQKFKKSFSRPVYDIANDDFDFTAQSFNDVLKQEDFYDFITEALYRNHPVLEEKLRTFDISDSKVFKIPDDMFVQVLKKDEVLFVWIMGEKLTFKEHFLTLEQLFNERLFSLEKMDHLGLPRMFSLSLLSKLRTYLTPID